MLTFLLLLQSAAAVPAAAAAPRFDASTFDPLVTEGIRRGAYPGAVLVVGRHDAVVFARGYGHFTWSPASRTMDPDSTLFDLASLTKVVATTTALMLLVERGQVDLDAPVVRYVPEFQTAAITVRQLLTHTSGLRADIPTPELRALPDSAALMRRVMAEKPRVPPGTRVIYSDLNAILLGEVVRRVSGQPLDAFATREIFTPLGLTATLFRPPPRLRPRIAPTGIWHGHPVAGVVNDGSAFKLGGVSGNAGVFATAADIARFARFILSRGVTADGRRLLRAETIELFTTKATSGKEARALG